MTDPYRTAARVETREERIERLRQVYYAWAMINVANRTPEELARIDEGYRAARDAYMRAIGAK